MRQLTLIILLVIGLAACHEQSNGFDALSDKESSEDLQIEPPRTAEPPAPPPIIEESEKEKANKNSIEKASKIIKDGDIHIEVKDLKKAKGMIDSTLNQFKAYYEDEHYQSSPYRSTYYLTIRIPTNNFDTFLGTIEKGNGAIIKKHIKARDVTGEYIDVAVRLNNNQTYLTQYRALLKRTNSIKEILEIQEKIRRIEEEIDARKGRLQYIDDKVRFSTLRIELVENKTVELDTQSPNLGKRIVNAFQNGANAFLEFLLILVSIWPFVLLIVGLWLFRHRIQRRVK